MFTKRPRFIRYGLYLGVKYFNLQKCVTTIGKGEALFDYLTLITTYIIYERYIRYPSSHSA